MPKRPKNTNRKVTSSEIDDMKNFVCPQERSIIVPYKRETNNRYLCHTYESTYIQFKVRQIRLGAKYRSFSTFYRTLRLRRRISPGLWERKIKKRSALTYRDCQCLKCVNFVNRRLCLIANGLTVNSRATIDMVKTICPFNIPTDIFNALSSESGMDDGKQSDVPQSLGGTTEVSGSNIDKIPSIPTMYVVKYASKKCVKNECRKCTALDLGEQLHRENNFHSSRDLALYREVIYQDWCKGGKANAKDDEEGQKPFRLYKRRATLQEVITRHALIFRGNYIWHLFVFKWQIMQYEWILSNLKAGEVVMVIDYAQNLNCRNQSEPSSSYFGRQQTLLCPHICYSRCQCGELVKTDIMIMSDRLDKKACAGEVYFQKALGHLRQIGVSLDRLSVFYDNSSAQFKNKTRFFFLGKSPIPTTLMFWVENHGKSSADASISETQQALTNLTKAEMAQAQHGRDLVKALTEYEEKKLAQRELEERTSTFPAQKEGTESCQHRHHSKVYHLIEGKSISAQNTQFDEMIGKYGQLTRVSDTKKQFCYRNNPREPGIVQYSDLGCLCPTCTSDKRDTSRDGCRQARQMDPWESHDIFPLGYRDSLNASFCFLSIFQSKSRKSIPHGVTNSRLSRFAY